MTNSLRATIALAAFVVVILLSCLGATVPAAAAPQGMRFAPDADLDTSLIEDLRGQASTVSDAWAEALSPDECLDVSHMDDDEAGVLAGQLRSQGWVTIAVVTTDDTSYVPCLFPPLTY